MADEEAFVSEDQTVDGGLLMLSDYRRLTRLYCMNGGYHLQILPDGTVHGQRDDRDDHSKTAAAHCAFFTSRSGLQHGCVHFLHYRCVGKKEIGMRPVNVEVN